MKKTIPITLSILGALALASGSVSAQTTLVSENFGTLANGTTIGSTGGTPVAGNGISLTYARISGGAGSSLNAMNPSSFGAGASALLVATSASLTGVGSSGLAGFSAGTLSFSLRTPAALGTFFFGTGTGGTFTANTTFSGNDLLAGFQISAAGLFQTRDSTNNFTTITGAGTIAASTSYTLQTVFNGSAGSLTYTGSVGNTGGLGGTVASGTADVYLNGALVGDDVSIRNAQSGTGFRIYTIGAAGATGYEVDDINVTSLIAVPEPATYAYVLGGLGMLMLIRRRRLA